MMQRASCSVQLKCLSGSSMDNRSNTYNKRADLCEDWSAQIHHCISQNGIKEGAELRLRPSQCCSETAVWRSCMHCFGMFQS